MQNDKQVLKNTTIKDVAQLANVSIATVSRTLSGKDKVSPLLAERVSAAMKELQYQPNDVARALKIKESRSIGLMIPDIENPFFPALVRGVQDAAKIHNYAVILCNTDGRLEEERNYIHFLYSKRVDGIVFTDSVYNKQSISLLDSLGIPVVLLDRRVTGIHASTVTSDNRLGAFLATEHLIELGKKRIAFISGPLKLSSGADRASGYQDALVRYNISYNKNLAFIGAFTYESSYKAVEDLLFSREKFDAVFASNDLMAIGVIECLAKYGIRVPEDVAVVGFDDIRMAAWYKPLLTTIRQPVYDMGQYAVKLLVEHITGVRETYYEKIFKPELIIRQSSGSVEERK
jgi:LacI family transcriptional regulator